MDCALHLTVKLPPLAASSLWIYWKGWLVLSFSALLLGLHCYSCMLNKIPTGMLKGQSLSAALRSGLYYLPELHVSTDTVLGPPAALQELSSVSCCSQKHSCFITRLHLDDSLFFACGSALISPQCSSLYIHLLPLRCCSGNSILPA